MEAHYYSRMNKIQQQVYHEMKVGLVMQETSFSVSKLDKRELQDIFFQLRLDCPEIFYAVGFRYRFFQNANHVEIIPEYIFAKKKIKEQQVAMEARIEKLLRPTLGMTEYQKECYIHNFICEKIRYDKLKKPYSHEIIGPLGQGVGVCEGIAKVVKVLCDHLNMYCIIVISDANKEKQIKYRHAWNIIQIAGVCYHVDATFDNTHSQGGKVRQDYLNLSDNQIFKDHEPTMYEVPKCKVVFSKKQKY